MPNAQDKAECEEHLHVVENQFVLFGHGALAPVTAATGNGSCHERKYTQTYAGNVEGFRARGVGIIDKGLGLRIGDKGFG